MPLRCMTQTPTIFSIIINNNMAQLEKTLAPQPERHAFINTPNKSKRISYMNACMHAHTHICMHTHNRFTALLDFVRDYVGEPAPEKQNTQPGR